MVFVTHSLTEAVYLADEVLVMSARPGRIIDHIEVTLPRPRTYEMMATDVFGRLRDRIWQQIRKDGVRSVDALALLPPPSAGCMLAVLLLLWEVVPLTGLLPELFLPSLSKTLDRALHRPAHLFRGAARHALRGRPRRC